MAKRQEYLRKQRDALLARKKEARNKQLETYKSEQEHAPPSPLPKQSLTEVGPVNTIVSGSKAQLSQDLARVFRQQLANKVSTENRQSHGDPLSLGTTMQAVCK